MKTTLTIFAFLLATTTAQASETRIDFSGQGAKDAYLRLREVARKSDAVKESSGAGSHMLSSSNLDCRYTSDDSGTTDLKRVDATRFSCYVLLDDKGNVGCGNVCPAPAARKPGAPKRGGER